ncbi:MAG: hypothetical protein ABI288_03020 [Ginsengibacter sp.]
MAQKNKFSRRDFVVKSATGFAGIAVSKYISGANGIPGKEAPIHSIISPPGSFNSAVENLPEEKPYDYHKKLSGDPIHTWKRNVDYKPSSDEMSIADKGWKIIYKQTDSPVLKTAVYDAQTYLEVSMGVSVGIETQSSLNNWKKLKSCIIAGTREELPGCGTTLTHSKDYEITANEHHIIVCGYDESGAMFGIYHLEAMLNLREAPFLSKNLKTVRHSLYNTRMVLSWMGWMEWPDQLLSHLVHDGFDGIFASVYANPNGDRTTANNSTDFYARILYNVRQQDPAVIKNLINRAARFGIKVYTPIIWQYLGTSESEAGLRKLVREMVNQFPEIRGYVLLTEGFWYKAWGGGHGASKEYMQEWARNWCKAVGIVEDECHRIDPSIEILPWEYNIDFRPQSIDIKKYFIQQLPDGTTPLLTWENGKSFVIDNMQGYLRDYSLSQVGPAEVTSAQIDEANKRGMKVFSKVDTFASWQYGTIPYLPCPYQWFDRYMALEKKGVKGTLESWSSGYKPNFISRLRAWTCWSDAPSRDELFAATASAIFGKEQKDIVIKAWDHFSQAIRLVPDTGPNMGTNNAIGNPLFFEEPPLRTLTYNYSWEDQSKVLHVNPHWPFTVSRMVFYPDFTNKINKAELYARSATGIEIKNDTLILPVFLKYLQMAVDQMEEGLKLYREAALASPVFKRTQAVKEVIVAEQMQRMMQSDHAILQFEDLRLQMMKEKNVGEKRSILDRMERIVEDEIARTQLSLLAATRDSRLGFQFEQDYVYTPYSLQEKIDVLKETLNKQIPAAKSIV